MPSSAKSLILMLAINDRSTTIKVFDPEQLISLGETFGYAAFLSDLRKHLAIDISQARWLMETHGTFDENVPDINLFDPKLCGGNESTKVNSVLMVQIILARAEDLFYACKSEFDQWCEKSGRCDAKPSLIILTGHLLEIKGLRDIVQRILEPESVLFIRHL